MQNNDSKQIAGAILIVGVLIAGAILLKGNSGPIEKTSTLFQGRPISREDHILGNQNAKIIVVEYSDLECPFCKSFHNTMHRVVNESNGDVAWVYRHYPIPQLHAKAFREAEATECAFEQGGNDAFWKYTDRIFEITPSNDGLEESELSKIAEYAGLDKTVFNNCLDSGKFRDKVQADVDDGIKAGVNGTPSSFVLKKGKVVDTFPGALPYAEIMQKIQAVK